MYTKKLRNALISDPNNILLNFIDDEQDRGMIQFPCWIRHNPNNRPANFYITALDLESKDSFYTKEDVWGGVKDVTFNRQNFVNRFCFQIRDTGFVVGTNGVVFSFKYPLQKIYLFIPDRIKVQVGDVILFQAFYYPKKHCFLIFNYSLAKNETSIICHPSYRGLVVSFKFVFLKA